MTFNDWEAILAESVKFTTENQPVTLRQAFYHLVSQQFMANTKPNYSQLSTRTAVMRREGTHPHFIDRTREVLCSERWAALLEAIEYVVDTQMLDRTQGQPERLAVICEKRGHAAMIYRDIGHLGWPIIESGGNSSVSIQEQAIGLEVDTALLVADFDASGLLIERQWAKFLPGVQVVRVALTYDQIDEFRLVKLPGKEGDRNNAAFIEEVGELFQVECDAIPPEALLEMVRDAVIRRMDLSTFDAVLDEERRQRDALRELLRGAA